MATTDTSAPIAPKLAENGVDTNGFHNGAALNGAALNGAALNGAALNGAPAADVETDVLIVGAGPAGASLACFLASHGLKGIMISSASSSADTPRAHITSMAALECLRDIGLDEECNKVATKGDCMVHTRWCHSMAGEEYARVYSWGNDPLRKGDYEIASPCAPSDLPQTLLEPLLVRYATLHGFKCRWNTSFLSFQEDSVDSGPITTTVSDDMTGQTYKIRSKFLFGADGARSRVVKQLDLPLHVKPGQGLALNVLVKADLTRLVENRKGNLHWIMQPGHENPDFGWIGIVRMVKPWHEWMFIMFPKAGKELQVRPTTEELLQRVREFIGDDSIPAEILGVSRWYINETVAMQYSRGNIFCLGDAVHRHPPFNGLGSNTCIQDAFNLAWKVAYVHKGLASPSLLSSYSVERQPVGLGIITRANTAFREHFNVWNSLGIMPETIEEQKKMLAELSSPSSAGLERRAAFQSAVRHSCHEFHGLGIEMGQRYTGPAIYSADETEEYQPDARTATDPVLYHHRNTYVGCRLPHAWLNTAIPSTPISTIDLAGHGGFTLLTGIGGEAWKSAVGEVSRKLKVPLVAYSIGFRQDWEDAYFEWEKVRGVEETGAILIRPDRFVAWRYQKVYSDEHECTNHLTRVMKSLLGLTETKIAKTTLT